MHHFANKASLLAAVLERRDEVDGAAFQADLAAGVGFFDALARLADRNAARPGHRRALRDAVGRGHRRPSTPRTRTSSSATARCIARRGRASSSDGGTPAACARAWTRAPRAAGRRVMDGLQVQWLLEGDGDDRVDMAAARVTDQVLVSPSAPSRPPIAPSATTG